MNIKEYVKSNKVLYKILSPIKFFVCSFIKARLIQYAFYIKRYFVYQGIVKENAQFNIIKKDRQKYKGKRCFIIGAGPSIKIEDLNLLKDEFTITMSTIIKFLDELEYIPDIYMVQDRISFLIENHIRFLFHILLQAVLFSNMYHLLTNHPQK